MSAIPGVVLRIACAAFAIIASNAAAAPVAPGRVLLPDGRHLFLNCTGQASPTVLLEGGYAADSDAWTRIQPVLAQSMRVCSYDRAGYGDSDMGPLPRDGRAVAADLDQALRKANIGGPFVLVGHSLGALYARIFAERRPADIAGMVLVDPSIEYQDKRFAAMFGRGAGSAKPFHDGAAKCLAAAEKGRLPSLDPMLASCVPDRSPATLKKALSIANWRTQLSEADTMWTATSDEADAGRYYYGDMPLIVLTAEDSYASLPAPARQAVSDFWRKLHDEIAARAMHGGNRVIGRSSHMMMFDRPDAIIDAVKEVVARTRR
jgi:pimeloyl-ACP methyl ester carboxylesterase